MRREYQRENLPCAVHASIRGRALPAFSLVSDTADLRRGEKRRGDVSSDVRDELHPIAAASRVALTKSSKKQLGVIADPR